MLDHLDGASQFRVVQAIDILADAGPASVGRSPIRSGHPAGLPGLRGRAP